MSVQVLFGIEHMGTIDLRSSFLFGSASWQLTPLKLSFTSTLSPRCSISSVLLIPLHTGRSGSARTLRRRRRRAHLSLISFFLSSVIFLGWGRGGLFGWLGYVYIFFFFRLEWASESVQTSHHLCTDTRYHRLETSWTARFCFIWLNGGKKKHTDDDDDW